MYGLPSLPKGDKKTAYAIIGVGALIAILIPAIALVTQFGGGPSPAGATAPQPIEVGPGSAVTGLLSDFTRYSDPEEYLRLQGSTLDTLEERLNTLVTGINEKKDPYAKLPNQAQILDTATNAITRVRALRSAIGTKSTATARTAAKQLITDLSTLTSLANTRTAKDEATLIRELHASIQPKVRCLLDTARQQGINLMITDGYRSIQEQDALYAQGRSAPGPIVTNAPGGKSFHNYGLAVDVVDATKGYTKTDWDTLGSIGSDCGLKWGGSFRTFTDRPHFQYTGGLTLTDLAAGKRPQ